VSTKYIVNEICFFIWILRKDISYCKFVYKQTFDNDFMQNAKKGNYDRMNTNFSANFSDLDIMFKLMKGGLKK
jgi:hypothetical protein